MTKIGFIDFFLDEWHANNYPKFIKEAVGDEFVVKYAYAKKDSEKGKTNKEWAAEFGVELLPTIEEVVEKSDVLIVLSPDFPEEHWDLCQIPLRSGKRTYVDKTFSLSKDIAQKLVNIAKESKTPFFSSSALRFSDELKDVSTDNISFINYRGPGEFETYAIHQIEPIVMMMGSAATRIMSVGSGVHATMVIEFANGRSAVMSHYGWTGVDFSFIVNYADGSCKTVNAMSNYFPNFIKEMCDFFKTGEIKAPHDQTITIVGIIEAGHKALKTPGVWIAI